MFAQPGDPITRLSGVGPDDPIPLGQAAALLPRRRRGRPTHVTTVYRWTTWGCRGVRLRYVQVGATRCTKPSWLAEFFDALTRASRAPRGEAAPGGPVRSSARRRREDRDVARELDDAGI